MEVLPPVATTKGGLLIKKDQPRHIFAKPEPRESKLGLQALAKEKEKEKEKDKNNKKRQPDFETNEIKKQQKRDWETNDTPSIQSNSNSFEGSNSSIPKELPKATEKDETDFDRDFYDSEEVKTIDEGHNPFLGDEKKI